jgi:cysteine synthase A
LAAYVSNTGSAGTIAAGDYLKTIFPNMKVVASEALQCPTLLNNGFGGHRIEGIGDKHVPWVHNVKNTDLVTSIDDEDCMRLMRLFNEPEGKQYLIDMGIDSELVKELHLLGISGIANMLSAIKTAKYFEYTEDDVIISLATDSMEMYLSRMEEEKEAKGAYNTLQAARDLDRCMLGQGIEYLKELSYTDRKAIHNLKYFTWVEQQEKDVKDLNRLWYDRELWPQLFNQAELWDKMIEEFNEEVKRG